MTESLPDTTFPVLGYGHTFLPLDLSSANEILQQIGIDEYIEENLPPDIVGYGGYLEHRTFYLRSTLFQDQTRTLHLGIDLWAPAGTPVYAPFPAVIHSLADNDNYLDYGPTIILRHQLSGEVFHTLYGHLSQSSLVGKTEGQPVQAGQCIGYLGSPNENGNWPPHLHLQCIIDPQGNRGDYPGVVSPDKRDFYSRNCPDPTPLIGLS